MRLARSHNGDRVLAGSRTPHGSPRQRCGARPQSTASRAGSDLRTQPHRVVAPPHVRVHQGTGHPVLLVARQRRDLERRVGDAGDGGVKPSSKPPMKPSREKKPGSPSRKTSGSWRSCTAQRLLDQQRAGARALPVGRRRDVGEHQHLDSLVGASSQPRAMVLYLTWFGVA